MAKKPKHTAEQYADDVISGKILAGQWIVKACKRHKADLKNGSKRGLYFDEAAGQHAIDFFGFLHHSKGEWAGKVFELSHWQEFIIWVLFGWMRADGLRRFRTAYNEVPRKNGKSTFAAGIGLYLFFADNEPGAEVYTAATKKDQAKITHSESERMVKASPMLRGRIGIFRDNLHIVNTASKFEPLGADADTLDGLNIHGAVLDELHAHKNRALYDVIETATGARRQPLLFSITTAGHNRHSVCWEQRDYATKILDNIIEDDTFFAYIACIDDGDDWTDPKIWAKANPNWMISVKPDDIERKCTKAKSIITAQNAFRRLHLDEWTEQEVRWLDLIAWDKCTAPANPDALKGRRCFLGMDLSTKIDLSALALLFPPDLPAGDWKALFKFYVPEENIRERVQRDRVPYDIWVKQGYITATPGSVIDYDFIKHDIIDWAKFYNIQEIAFDPWNATYLSVQLAEEGFNLVEMRQGHRTMAEPSKELEALVKSGRFSHGANPVMRWMASNVTVRMDSNDNYMPDKAKSTERIDGIVASLMALGRGIVSTKHESVYSSRGIMTL